MLDLVVEIAVLVMSEVADRELTQEIVQDKDVKVCSRSVIVVEKSNKELGHLLTRKNSKKNKEILTYLTLMSNLNHTSSTIIKDLHQEKEF